MAIFEEPMLHIEEPVSTHVSGFDYLWMPRASYFDDKAEALAATVLL
jgi:hypothetical protein